ncbi:class I adenylate-forming enzyme family protein [Thiohalomonas denitrificans]|uniref:class I adenylate-forming enzyme family protein n=1 Tax=Thiohalomonas denitrificans TaxID=415747 RepID=UPI0026F32402|nr:AMP-binding protein [Thiohalomonas denitrificans]
MTVNHHRDDNGPATWLGSAAGHRPDTVALSAVSGQSLTYRELYTIASQLAAGLLAAGIGPRRPLVLDLPAWETAIALHAGLLAGIPLLPLDPHLPRPHRLRLLAASGARIALTTGAQADEGLETITFAEALEAPVRSRPPPTPGLHGVQLIIGTSGSSGPPKGVMLSAGNLAAAVTASRAQLPLAAGDCWLGCLPLTHIGGLSVLLRCAEAGATVRLHDRFEAKSVWSDLQAGTATHISLVPAMLDRLLEVGVDSRPPRLAAALVGGGALADSLRGRGLAAGWPLYLSYGMSETASQIATRRAVEPDDASVGKPLPGFEVRVEQARLAVRGPAVMLGYANPELIPGDGLTDDGWFLARDLVRLESGRLTVLGRVDDVLVSGGEKVHPAIVERLLGACPGIGEVAVSAAFDSAWGDRLVAFFTGTTNAAAVETWAREHLQGGWRPRSFLRLEALPRQGTGKLDRRRLRRLAEDMGVGTSHSCPNAS